MGDIDIKFEEMPVERNSKKSNEGEDEELLRNRKSSLAKPPKKSTKEKVNGLIDSVYNKEYREFLSKDAMGWLKLSAFYSVFYFFLAMFFCALLFLFWAFRINGSTAPVYYNTESVMHYKVVNPGLGFRPHLQPEDSLIFIDTQNSDEVVQSMSNFLEEYEQKKTVQFSGAHDEKVTYNSEEILKDSPCTKENSYGLQSTAPCVAVKLNRIYGWTPKEVDMSALPDGLNETIKEASAQDGTYIYVSCAGQESMDIDNIKEIEYYSSLSSRKVGGIDFKYYPYTNQPDYISPLVFVHFKTISANTLINVECKAYAGNIDNVDRLNQRGMTKFSLFVKDPTNKVEPVTEAEAEVTEEVEEAKEEAAEEVTE